MMAVESVPGGLTRMGFGTGVKKTVREVNCPDGEAEGQAAGGPQWNSKNTCEQGLPQDRDHRGVQAQQVRPDPRRRHEANIRSEQHPAQARCLAGEGPETSGSRRVLRSMGNACSGPPRDLKSSYS